MYVTRRLGLCLWLGIIVWVGSLTGCNNSSDPQNSARNIVLVDLLPASTRGLFQMSGLEEPADIQWVESIGDDAIPWRHIPSDILRYYSGEMDLVGAAEKLILAQVTVVGDDYVLLVDIDKSEGEALLSAADLVDAGQYRGFQLLAASGTELLLARFNDRTWVIAPRSSVELVIDVHLGTLPNIHQSAIANYLSSLEEGQPVTFVYGLPGLYKQVVAPGYGVHSLSQATVVRGAFSLQDSALDGRLQFVSANAVTYTQRLLPLLPANYAASIEAIDDRINIDLTGLSPDKNIRTLLKSLYIGMDAIDYSEAVIEGGNAPWLPYKVGVNPNSLYINFEFRNGAQREMFTADHLPPGFTLAPIRLLETDVPRYFLVLNFYQSPGGFIAGARAEWSVFVNDPDGGQPRFLVIQAATQGFAADPVNLLTPPGPVSHVLVADAITSYVGVVNEVTGEETTYFSSSVRWPQVPERHVSFSREFAAANDHVFWGNAVADGALYNATAHNRSAILIARSEISFVDNSPWSGYVNPEPVNAWVYSTPLEFAITAMWNLDADYLDVTENYRQTLIDFKNSFYPSTVLGFAEDAMRGNGTALTNFATGDSVPTTRFHFVITDPLSLFASIGVDDLFTPLAIALHDGEPPNYYLSLVIYGREDDPCGTRAEWVTYVPDAQGRPQTLQLEAFASDACLDSISLLGLPAVVEQNSDGAQLHARIISSFIRFESQLDVTRGEDALPGLDWIEAGDQVCALNGVCDHFLYSGQTLVQPVTRVDVGGVTIDKLSTPWDDFIQTSPAEVTVQQRGQRTEPQIQSNFASYPWKNVLSFGY